MDKTKFAGLASFFGLKVNEDAIEEIADPEADAGEPAEEPEGEPAAAPAEPPKANASPKQEPKVAANSSDDAEWFKNLFEEIGGREAFKSLMLNAVKAVETMQTNEKKEKEILVANIVANAANFTEDELKGMNVEVLRKLADNLVPQFVDYSMQGNGLKENAEIAAVPDIYSPDFWKGD